MNIVSFSTGLSSALTAIRVMDRFGKDVKLVFMDTLFEDVDNYRFMDEFEKRFDVEIIKLNEGRNPYQLFVDQHVIPNSRIAPCTEKLKISLFRRWMKEHCADGDTIHIGYDYSEVHRCEATLRNYEKLGYKVDFPLLWKPIEYRQYSDVIRDYGIDPPRMYSMGYTHANCGGRCVKQGQGDWLRTLVNFPDNYAEIERWEAEMQKNEINKTYAILKTQTKEGTNPLSLKELRERYEDKLVPSLFCSLDVDTACVHCGIE